MAKAQRMMVAEVPLGDVSPRFTAGSAPRGVDDATAIQRRAWFSIQPALSQRLQPLLDDGWLVVPSSLGPHSLHMAVERAPRSHALPLLDRFTQHNARFVRSATVLLQKPVH